MAQPNRERGRRPLDFYETPPHYVRALLDVIGQPHGHVYDPCVGTHAITRYLVKAKSITTNDIDPKRRADTHDDATTPKAWGTLGYEWCITNPPFSDELAILTHALQYCKNVAMLARLSFLEPTVDRRPFWKRYAERCTVTVLPRYSFRANDEGKRQTDSVTCCWLVWWEARTGNALHVSQRQERGK